MQEQNKTFLISERKQKRKKTHPRKIETTEIPKPEKKGSIFLPAVLIFIVVGLIGGLIAFYKKFWPKSSGAPTNPAMNAKERKMAEEEDVYETEEPRPMSDEEIIAQMRAEYKESVARQRQMDEADEDLSRNATIEEDDYTDLDEVTQEDFDNDETIEEYTEGDTGLLSQKDNPADRRSGNSFFDDDDDF